MKITSSLLKPLATFGLVVLAIVFVVNLVKKEVEDPAPVAEVKEESKVLKNDPKLSQERILKYSQASHRAWPEMPKSPSDVDIKNSRLFAVPLIATKGLKQTDNDKIGALLVSLRELSLKERYEKINDWLAENPSSRWADSLRYQQASYRHSRGYFTESREQWSNLWDVHKQAKAGTGAHALGNEVLSRLLDTNISVARTKELRALIEDMEGREITGVLNGKRFRAKQAMWLLEHTGAQNIMCGPLALNAIADNANQPYRMPVLGKVTPDYIDSGLPLFELASMAEKNYGFSPTMVKRTDFSAGIPTPSVLHSIDEHYFAVLEKSEDGTEYFIEDQTLEFTGWVDQEALERSMSGNFLLASANLPKGFKKLSKSESLDVFGRDGAHGSANPSSTTTDDDPSCQVGCGGEEKGMPVYVFQPMPASLKIKDIPLSYSTPIGGDVAVRLVFNPMDTSAPGSAPGFSNVGQNWSLDWISWIDAPVGTVTASSELTIHRPGGGTQTSGFRKGTSGVEAVPFSKNFTRTEAIAGGYATISPNGSQLVYDVPDSPVNPSRYFLGKAVDIHGNAVSFSYDAAMRLTRVTDAIGQVTTLRYEHPTDVHKITSVVDPFGRRATLEYNPQGQLIAITDQINLRSSFEYDSNGDIVKMITPYGTTTFEQGGTGTVRGSSNRYVQATDPLGQIEHVKYIDLNGGPNPGLVNQPPTSVTVDGVAHRLPIRGNLHFRNSFYWDKEAWHHNPNDYKAARVTHWYTTAARVVPYVEGTKKPFEDWVWFSYPGSGTYNLDLNYTAGGKPNKTYRVQADEKVRLVQTDRNALGNPIKVVDPLGRTTLVTYAANNVDLLSLKQVNGTSSDTLFTATYNTTQQPLTVTDAAGRVVTYTYNAKGQPLTITDPLGRVVTFTYDQNSYLVAVDGPLVGDQDKATMTYDAVGRLKTRTSVDGYTVQYEYDDFDRVTRIVAEDGTDITNVYDRLSLISSTDRIGRKSSYTYDALQRLVSVTDPQNQTTRFEWCRCGDMKKLIDAKGQVTKWLYDIQGRLETKTYSDNSTETYTYDLSTGESLTSTNRKGDVSTYVYNLDGTNASVSYSDADSNAPKTQGMSYVYDAVYTRLLSMTDRIGTTQYTYNAFATGNNGAGQVASIDGPWENDVIGYSYDSLGRPLGKTIDGVNYGSGTVYDTLDRVTSFTDALGNYQQSYDGATARLLSGVLPNGVTSTYAYGSKEDDFRLQEIHHKSATGQTISKFNYTHTAEGRIESWTRQFGVQAPSTYQYGYDQIDQLKSAVLSQSGVMQKHYAFTYDPIGNRSSKQIGSYVQTASHNGLNQLTQQVAGGATRFYGQINKAASVTVNGQKAKLDTANRFESFVDLTPGQHDIEIKATDGNGVTTTQNYDVTIDGSDQESLTYDRAGNVLRKTIGGIVTNYQWDALNRLIQIESGNKRTQFLYDGQSQRVGRSEYTHDGNTWVLNQDVKYLWCGGFQPTQERDSSGAVVTRHHFAGGFADVQPDQSLKQYYCTKDHLGSTREIVNEAGVVETRYDYSPFGELELIESTSNNIRATFLYTGHLYHEESDLHLTQFRAYDPTTGRWLSPDPIKEDGGLNLYAYVENDPINYIDEAGEFPVLAVIGIITAGVAIYGVIQAGREYNKFSDSSARAGANRVARRVAASNCDCEGYNKLSKDIESNGKSMVDSSHGIAENMPNQMFTGPVSGASGSALGAAADAAKGLGRVKALLKAGKTQAALSSFNKYKQSMRSAGYKWVPSPGNANNYGYFRRPTPNPNGLPHPRKVNKMLRELGNCK